MAAHEAFGIIEKSKAEPGIARMFGQVYHGMAGAVGETAGMAGAGKSLKMMGDGKKVRARALGRASGFAITHPHAAGYGLAASPAAVSAGAVGADMAASKIHQKVSKRDFSTKQRMKLASKGDALPDGSFPVKNKGDLKNAEKLEGHSKHPAEVKAYIDRKKKELSKSHTVFLDEDVVKAFGDIGGIGSTLKQGTSLVGGALKPLVKKPAVIGGGLGAAGGGLMGQNKVKGAAIGGGLGAGAAMGAMKFRPKI